MPVTPASLKVVHPEFVPKDDARVQIFIDRASRQVNVTQWGSRSDDGITELACHMLFQADKNGKAAPSAPTSDHAGDVSTSYSTSQGESRNDTELSATSYGRTYMQLRRLIFPDRCNF